MEEKNKQQIAPIHVSLTKWALREQGAAQLVEFLFFIWLFKVNHWVSLLAKHASFLMAGVSFVIEVGFFPPDYGIKGSGPFVG